jgi:indolepyruvate ferredoxin oxidoreductase
MVRGATGAPDLVPLIAALRELTKPGSFTEVDTVALATALFGDAIAANLIALGAAYQAGAVPLEAASIARAIELNGVAVDRNQAAFLAGRLAVHDPGRLPSARRAGELRREPAAGALKAAAAQAADRGITGPAADLAARRAAELVSYQNPALASRYLDLVAAAARAEADLPGGAGGPGELPLAVADGFFHLLAYKDEYEVARLHLLPEFRAALAEAVPGGHGIRYQLHPPVLRALGMRRKLALPAPVARPAFGVLRAMRHVRGTPADVFGYSRVRRTERRLAAEYEDGLRAVLPGLDEGRLAAMVALARLPLGIRGYEHIKLAAITRYAADRAKLLCELGGGELGGPAEGPA